MKEYYYFLIYSGIVFIVLAFASGFIRRKLLDTAGSILLALVGIDLVGECFAFYCARQFHQNIPILRMYSLLEIVFVALYFNYSVPYFRKYHIGYCIAGFSFFAGVADCLFYTPIYQISQPFVFFEGLVILISSFLSLFQLVKANGSFSITSLVHFWITAVLIIYWSLLVLSFTFYNLVAKAGANYIAGINLFLLIVNYLYYLTLSLIFFRYPKMQTYA